MRFPFRGYEFRILVCLSSHGPNLHPKYPSLPYRLPLWRPRSLARWRRAEQGRRKARAGGVIPTALRFLLQEIADLLVSNFGPNSPARASHACYQEQGKGGAFAPITEIQGSKISASASPRNISPGICLGVHHERTHDEQLAPDRRMHGK
ncbi:hypothetical protein EJ06DRAFT_412504 [Trichodelitschia bisporula]|uniref:Uncharacterized protein n=1 Tax=Trichodelitschia bisporula TaxID=703511 RepID=A0A6G1HYT9_9PEZI|nr:hypothetical protein EJ06DRAFT_412504 [Trichodelitschia bisporula]